MAQPVKARPLLAYVLALAAAMTVPPLLLAGVTTSRWVTSEQSRLHSTTREMADRALSQVDRYLAGKIEMLQALATSPAVDGDDFRRLDQQARELLDLQGLNVVMRTLSGQHLLNTRVPWGSALPLEPIHEADQEVARTLVPVISSLYPGAVEIGPLVRVIVPVIRNGTLWYLLTASLSPEAISGLLGIGEAGIASPYFGSVADREGRILARSNYDSRAIGEALPGFDRIQGETGSWSGSDVNGVAVYGVYRRSSLSGWTFATGIDQALVDAPLYRSLAGLGLLAVALGLLALGISSGIARRIVGSQRQLVAAAEALGIGRPVVPPQTRVREANRVGLALADASDRLRDQALALVEANRELERRVEERTREVSEQAHLIKTTLHNMDQGLMLIDADGTVPICNQRALDMLDLPAELMRSRPAFMDVLRHQMGSGEFARSGTDLRRWVEGGGLEQTMHSYERERPNGTVIEIRTVPFGQGGAVRTYTDITARKSAERLSHDMARHDALTGLPNRILLRERLGEELGRIRLENGTFAVFCFDLDRFKLVNDTLGHPAGDELLRVAAQRIGAVLGAGDLLARLGGDEFAIIQIGGEQPGAAAELAAAAIEAIRAPFLLDGHVVTVGASVGIAIAPQDGREADQIFKNADLALYAAKNGGRNTFCFFHRSMAEAIEERQALELDLRLALTRGEFEVHYQPIIGLADDRITAFEALLRWHHPERGPMSPTDFIPLLEDTRLIVPVGAWVLREACRAAVTWPGEIRVLVNLSGIQIEDAELVPSVLGALAITGLPAGRLQLEITETILMHESEAIRSSLQSLREFGVRLALDDFGTGYSSLGYLQHFTLDGIKIDKSFVAGRRNPTTSAVLSAVVGLGRELGIVVTAEGVETAEQLDYVRRAGCDEVQGFLFSRPVLAEEAVRLIASEMPLSLPQPRAA